MDQREYLDLWDEEETAEFDSEKGVLLYKGKEYAVVSSDRYEEIKEGLSDSEDDKKVLERYITPKRLYGFLRIRGEMRNEKEVKDSIRKKFIKESDAEFFKVEYPHASLGEDKQVGISLKIPEKMYEALKRISYFSGMSMKDVVVELIYKENRKLNEFIFEEEFSIGKGSYDFEESYFGLRYR